MPAGSCFFLPFFFLALLSAGGRQSRMQRMQLATTWQGLAACQLAKIYLRRQSLGEPPLLELFTKRCLYRQTKAWNSPTTGQGVRSLLGTLLSDAVTGGSPTRPWSAKGVGPATSLRFAIPQRSPLPSSKPGEAMSGRPTGGLTRLPKVAGAVEQVFPTMRGSHSGGLPRLPKGARGPLGTLSRRASSGGLTKLPKASGLER